MTKGTEFAATAVAEIVGVPALGSLFGLVRKAAQDSFSRKFRIWMEDVAAALEFGDSQSLIDVIEEKIDEDWARESVAQAGLAIVNTFDDAVLPTLAALSADYIKSKRTPDLFHRRVCRFLAESSEVNLVHAKHVLTGLQPAVSDEAVFVSVEVFAGKGRFSWHRDPSTHHMTEFFPEAPGLKGTVRLLSDHGFGSFRMNAQPTSPDDPVSYSISFETDELPGAIRLGELIVVRR